MQHTIGVIMGSDNDMEIMKEAVTTLREFGLKAEVIVALPTAPPSAPLSGPEPPASAA